MGTRTFSKKIFPHFVNRIAFLDTVSFSVNGALAGNCEKNLVHKIDTGILRPGVVFSRCLFAETRLTGNQITIHHGRVKKFSNVPPLKVKLRSEKRPVTGAEAIFLIRRVTSRASEVKPTYVELTFDISDVEFTTVERQVFHRARRVTRLHDEKGRQTLYIGSPKSSYQVRIYQKTDEVIRIELVFRRPFLSGCGINRPEDILLLRRLNIWRLFSLRRFSRTQAKTIMRKSRRSKLGKLLAVWMHSNRTSEHLISTLRHNRIDPCRVFRKTSLQEMLERMQRRLVW